MWMLGIGVITIFLLLSPACHFSHWASLASLSVGFLCAITGMSLIELSKTEHPIAILFYFNLFSGIISFFPFAYAGLSFPSIDLCAHLIAISFFGVCFQYALIQSYASVSPQLVGSLVYSSIFYSAILGWWIWGEQLDTMQLGGAILLIASCLAMIRQSELENQKSKSC